MTATFFRHGEGRSINARRAEADGRMPLSRAKKAVAGQFGCSQSVAAAALEFLHDGEWHHVGKYAAAVAYYDTHAQPLGGTARHIAQVGGARKFAERRKQLKAARGWCSTERPRNRIATWAANRAMARAVAVEVLGRPLAESHRVSDWRNLWPLTEERGTMAIIRAGRLAGWSDERIILALVEAGHRDAEWLRNWMLEAG